MTATKTPANLHTKLARFRSEFGAVEKTGKNKTQGYGFAEAAVIGKRAVELATEIGLTFVPIRSTLLDARPTASEKQNVFTVGVDFQVTDVDTGESIIVSSIGQGADNADKGGPKALSNAMKYAVLLLLQAVAEDPEADAKTDELERSPRPRGQQPTLQPRATKPVVAETYTSAATRLASPQFKSLIRALGHKAGVEDDDLKALALEATGKRSSKDWTVADAELLKTRLELIAAAEEIFEEVRVAAPAGS